MFSTGLVITFDIKADGVIKKNNRPLKTFDYTRSMRAQILKCNNQDGGVYIPIILMQRKSLHISFDWSTKSNFE